MYGLTIRRSRLWPGPARDDQRVPVAEARLDRREVDALGEQPALVAQEPHRVVGERAERLGHARPLLGERLAQLVGAQHVPARDPLAAAVEAAGAHREHVALGDRVEEVGAGRVDQAHAALHERQRPGVREAAPSATRRR